QIRREQDLSSLRTDDPVSDRKKPVQVKGAVCAGVQDMICVLNHEGVVASGNELHEDLVVLERTRVCGIQNLGAITLATRDRGQDGAHESSLPRTGRSLKDKNGFARGEISFDEPIHRLSQSRI